MKRHKTLAILAVCLGSSVLLLGLLAGFVPQHESYELRRRASPVVVSLRPEDMPVPIVAQGSGSRQWSLRRAASPVVALAPLADALARAEVDDVSSDLFGQAPAGPGQLASLLALDGFSMPLLLAVQPLRFGDAVDARGLPLRWLAAETLLEGYSPLPPRTAKAIGRASAGSMLAADACYGSGMLPPRARRYQQLVESFAGRYKLSTELVYAIIHSESSFSPTLVSHKSAMGLMQILPDTAGGEVHRYLYGRTGDVTFADLSEPETNIRYGTTYLHILLTRYFAGVHDPRAREYCAVAAYNMGPNRFLRIFGDSPQQAVDAINALTAEQLYEDLTIRLPVAETRAYVAKVARMKGHYAALQ